MGIVLYLAGRLVLNAPLAVFTHGNFFIRQGNKVSFNPAAQGIYYELTIRLHDLIVRCLAQQLPDRLPAGSFSSVCGTLFGGIHPDTGRAYAVMYDLSGLGAGAPAG
jgi:N-methylhydantoinase B